MLLVSLQELLQTPAKAMADLFDKLSALGVGRQQLANQRQLKRQLAAAHLRLPESDDFLSTEVALVPPMASGGLACRGLCLPACRRKDQST